MSDAEQTDNFSPRLNTCLLGHEAAEQVLLNAWKNNTLHNSWLISGIEGVGKATLAYRFARFLLAADESRREIYTGLTIGADNPVFKLIAGNAHPDFKIIERDYIDTDRKKILKALKGGEAMSDDELKSLKKSAVIRVDDVRTINEFLSRKSAGDSWRVVIVDSIDDMNIASANAVLKILEEPPHKTVILLLSHNPGKLLPTIKSRCAKLHLQPLKPEIIASLLRRYRPELTEDKVKKLSGLASGSIGKALNYADWDAVSRYESLNALVSAGKNFSLNSLLEFCNSAVTDEDSYFLNKEIVLKYIVDFIKSRPGNTEIIEAWDNAVKVFDETERLNLDKKQTLINIINNLCKRV